ncbi:hypothetical protein F6X40_27565 [Paraburkholderia sp. UCT31]|uniref:hypothetical protein n=1 Tax=Paraburkholderia sp. UCT31 TaxID=2615209 RepID=UPI0016566073|nr:hypothetical protein [Paraburkholderia sp. UCT31]MBC8740419.1 hypothetical protein [Paraburkholderia sp. UCT31]
MKLPTMTKVSESKACTKWTVQFPSTLRTQGGTYHATTYPASDLVFVETAVKRRPVRGVRVVAAIRAALAAIKA